MLRSSTTVADPTPHTTIENAQAFAVDNFLGENATKLVVFLKDVLRNLGVETEGDSFATRCLALAVAHVLQAATKGKAAFEIGFIASFVVKAMTGSATAVNILSRLVPGALNDRELSRQRASYGRSVEVDVCSWTDVVCLFDNISASYKGQRHARLCARHIITIVTNMRIAHVVGGAKQLQKDVKHSPECFTFTKLAEEFAEETADDREILDAQVHTYLLERARSILDSGFVLKDETGRWHAVLGDQDEEEECPLHEEEDTTGPEEKPCGTFFGGMRCGKMLPRRARICPICKTDELEQTCRVWSWSEYQRWQKDSACAGIQSRFMETGKRKVPQRDGVIVYRGVDSTTEKRQKTRSGDENDAQLGCNIVEDGLPIMNLNPTSTSVSLIYERFGEYVKMRGFVEDDMVEREWAYMLTDEGAALNEDLFTIKHVRFHRLLGGGHEEAVYLRMITKLLWTFAGKELAIHMGFDNGENAESFIAKATDLHKAYEFVIDFLRPAITDAIITEYLTTACGDDFKVQEFIAWADIQTDRRFRFAYRVVVRDEVPALAAYRSGLRRSGKDHDAARLYFAARRVLLPTVFSRGHMVYGPALVMDLAYHTLSSPEVRAQREALISHRGQALDFGIIEQNNRVLKRHVGHAASSETAWRNASSHGGLLERCRATLFNFIGMSDHVVQADDDLKRRCVDRSMEARDATRWLTRRRVFRPTDDRKFEDVKGDALIHNSDEYRKVGTENLKGAQKDVRRTQTGHAPGATGHVGMVILHDSERRKNNRERKDAHHDDDGGGHESGKEKQPQVV